MRKEKNVGEGGGWGCAQGRQLAPVSRTYLRISSRSCGLHGLAGSDSVLMGPRQLRAALLQDDGDGVEVQQRLGLDGFQEGGRRAAHRPSREVPSMQDGRR